MNNVIREVVMFYGNMFSSGGRLFGVLVAARPRAVFAKVFKAKAQCRAC